MSAPSKAYPIQLVKIQPEERLATTSELNPALGGVTCHREARGMGYWAATQVKGLSPVMSIVSEADVVHGCGRQYFHSRYWRGYVSPTGSETVARYQKDSVGTREAQCISRNFGICDDKLIIGKESQMMHWESDQFIVVMKSCNGDGAKGLAGRPWNGDTSSRHRAGQRKSTKPISVTHSAEGGEVFLKSRMRENRTYGPVREFIVAPDENNFRRRWL